MYTQKDLLRNAIRLDHKPTRLYLISSWLEDINWHSENALFCERNIDKDTGEYIEEMQWLLMALNPNNYSLAFVKDHATDLKPYYEAIEKGTREYAQLITLPETRRTIGDSVLYDWKTAQKTFSVLSHLTGYGLDNDWNNTTGLAFIEEIEELLKEEDKKDEERAETMRAYERLAD